MTPMIPQSETSPPERTATAAELAREATRLLPCRCGADPGYTCDGQGGIHLGRYADARSIGHLTGAQMTAVLAAVPGGVFTALTIVRLPAGGAR